MKRTAAMALAAVVLGGAALAARENGKPAADWRAEVMRGLRNTITLDLKAMPLNRALAFMSRLSGVTIVLDASLPAEVAGKPVTLSAKDDTLQAVLGKALQQAGLRYMLKDGGVFVSTVGNLVKTMLAPGKDDSLPEAARPFTPADALALSGGKAKPWLPEFRGGKRALHTGEVRTDDAPPDLSNPYEAIGFEPWRTPRKPYVDPETGITQFPAPPVWVAAENEDDPRYRFTDNPSFLKPEYLWETACKDGGRDALEERELLGRLTKLLEQEDDLTQKEVLKQLIHYLRRGAKSSGE